jgi:hypothetical protein
MNRAVTPDLLRMAELTNLEPAAALVMIWAFDLYRTGSAARLFPDSDKHYSTGASNIPKYGKYRVL